MNLDRFKNKTLHWLRAFDFVRTRTFHFQQTFGPPSGRAVLRDLAPFCRANGSTFDPDPRIHALLEGRREVWLRIQQHLNLTPEELTDLFYGPNRE